MPTPETLPENHSNLGWRETEEGIELSIQFPQLRPDSISAEAWHRLHLIYEHSTNIVLMTLADEEKLRARGQSIEGSLTVLSTYLLDVTHLFHRLAGDDDFDGYDEVPF